MPNLEEASRCPRCDVPGREVSVNPGPRRSKIHMIMCENEACKWYSTTWIVQVKADGTIPERKAGGPKEFPELSIYQQRAAERYIEHLKSEDPKLP